MESNTTAEARAAALQAIEQRKPFYLVYLDGDGPGYNSTVIRHINEPDTTKRYDKAFSLSCAITDFVFKRRDFIPKQVVAEYIRQEIHNYINP